MTRWFFAHLMKTGGTSLFFMLQRQFPRESIFPPKSAGDMGSTDTGSALVEMANPLSPYQLVSGHYPLACVEKGAGEWKTFTLLRHPLTRVLSALRRQSDHSASDTAESIYNDPMRFQMLFDNHMVKMLGVEPGEMGAGLFSPVKPDRRHLDRALAALERFDAVGVVEDFEPFVSRLETTFGWDLGKRLEVNRAGKYDIPDALVERVRQDNQLDFELYAEARRMLGLPAVDDLDQSAA